MQLSLSEFCHFLSACCYFRVLFQKHAVNASFKNIMVYFFLHNAALFNCIFVPNTE